ncbi:uncharacterized protein LOC129777890 [Toxorhynchites rutilus septentrionalis]|uniref:uncharacterized protein LOC129777890 n=1 Tax=Toxorhynchites rutilus septentrionalis TaxID=329112 RepID=UPI00247ADF96|nr:uncharacterized protein LOC129777890 [Toxorhynchites rutilus septentrionalis]
MVVLLFRFALFSGISIALSSPITEFRDNLCLNGSRNELGECICNAGYALYRGNCFLKETTTRIESHVRPRANNLCPPGFNLSHGRCIPTTCAGTLCGSSCPPGYELRKGFCEMSTPQCPPGMVFQKGLCYYGPLPPISATVPPLQRIQVVPPMKIDIPVPEYIDPLDPNEVDQDINDKTTEIIPERKPQNGSQPVKNIVNNVNTVNAPTNVSTHNVNNVYIHITRTKADGVVKAVVIRNNETTVYDEQPSTEQPVIDITDQSRPPCCVIVSPRICRKQQHDEWVCFHRKHYRCGNFCTSDIMYLKPQRPSMKDSVLVMPPTSEYSPLMRYGVCRWGVCPPLDCSGCLQGKYRCHYRCYTYDCPPNGGCNFLNQDEFCDGNEDEICTAED